MFAAAYNAPVGECAKQERRPLASVLPGPNCIGDVGAAILPTNSHLVSAGVVAGLAWSPDGRPHTLAADVAEGSPLLMLVLVVLGSGDAVPPPLGTRARIIPSATMIATTTAEMMNLGLVSGFWSSFTVGSVMAEAP
ncbi:hypothetical protein D9M69_633490 [compost metagenome]